jgi:hypothetical protein
LCEFCSEGGIGDAMAFALTTDVEQDWSSGWVEIIFKNEVSLIPGGSALIVIMVDNLWEPELFLIECIVF